MIGGTLSPAGFDQLMQQAVSHAAGRPWYQARLLAHTAMDGDGRILGALLLRGVRAADMSLAEFCAAVWALVTENSDSTDLMKKEARLTMPPPDADPADFDDADDFQAMAQRARNMPGFGPG